jgi:class 3 adenylate cyclase/tetratricopeptide (TPR) repeat protein
MSCIDKDKNMSEIARLLQGLGLGQYAEVFARQEVDLEAARLLGDADFAALGIPLGPRRKIQAALKTGAGGAAEPVPAPAAERRQLTVLFCDLVGSTALSRRIDPEELRALMGSYQATCRVVVERYSGQVAQYRGDGVMVYFGWPVAHEDDAERALRASLELVSAVKRVFPAPEPLQVRIGVATGPVVVGEGRGEGDGPRLAVGETPNVAARLQSLAGEDEIVVGTTTRRLAGGVFDYQDMGHHMLKGITEPVQAWRLRSLVSTEGRFEASRGGEHRLSTFVGRAQEMALLGEKWAQACRGEGQIVLLEGEPGIGKSRITQWLFEYIGGQRHYRMRYQCSPYHAQSAFHPVIEQIERAAKFGPGDSAEARLDKLQAVLDSPQPKSAQAHALFASLVGLSGWEQRHGALNLTPEKQKELTVQALSAHVVGLAEDAPVLLLLEDAHWIDPSTLESLGHTVATVKRARVLLLITYRPEFKPAWIGLPHVSQHTLDGLPPEQTRALAEHVAGGMRLPEDVVAQIVDKTDGIPLFIEELTRAVLEAGLLELDHDTGGYRLEGPLSPIAIPATLRDILTARLDRLSPTKEVAQIGACIGRDFAHRLLEKVADLPEAQLGEALQRLRDSELVFQRGQPPAATYTFKHALIRDAAYDGLLRSRRVQIHARIAEVLEQEFAEVSKAQPEIVARHWQEAARPDRSAPLWLQAGLAALAKNSLNEAIAHLSSGLTDMQGLPAGEGRDSLELQLRVWLATAGIAQEGWATLRVPDNLGRAREIARTRNDSRVNMRIIVSSWQHEMSRGAIRHSLQYADEAAREAKRLGDPDFALFHAWIAINTHYWLGEYEPMIRLDRDLTRLYDPVRHHYLADLGNHDPYSSRAFVSHAVWMTGFPDQAVEVADDSIEKLTVRNHPLDRSFIFGMASQVHAFRRNAALYGERLDRAAELAREYGQIFIEYGWVGVNRGWLGLIADQPEAALRAYDIAFPVWVGAGMGVAQPYLRGFMALALGQCGQFQRAVDETDRALEQVARPGWEERAYLPEILRARALAFEGLGADDKAEETYRQSLATSAEQGTKSWELRTATSYARFMNAQGRRQEAIALLRPVYDWFTEGRDSRDHLDALQLLHELNG